MVTQRTINNIRLGKPMNYKTMKELANPRQRKTLVKIEKEIRTKVSEKKGKYFLDNRK